MCLLGSLLLLTASGSIPWMSVRLFFTMVMLEVTNQLELVPYVALTAIISTFVASLASPHGLYHALIEAAS